MVKPVSAFTGPVPAAHTLKRYQGAPTSSLRSTPKTSQATANSNGDTPSNITAATTWRRIFLAGSLRTVTILPLFKRLRHRHNGLMFAAYCSGHGRRVLLFSEHIEELVNRPDGMELRWRCPCGTGGTTYIHRHDAPVLEVA